MNIIPTENLSDERLSLYIGYNEPQLLHNNEPAPGVFIAETPIVIGRALESGSKPLSFFVKDKNIENEEIQNLLKRAGDPDTFSAPLDVINNITGFNLTRGVLAAFLRPPLPDPDALLSQFKNIVVLEDIVHPTNIGAIFRSAAALSAQCVLLTAGSSDPYYRKSARVSMGTVFQIPWTYVPGGTEVTGLLHRYSFTVISMALTDGAIPVNDLVLKSTKKKAVIFGSEGSGLCEDTLANIDHIAIIPIHNNVDSLNVAALSAVALYELFSK